MKQLSLSVNSQIELCLLTPSAAPALYALVNENRATLKEWLPWVDQVQTLEDARYYIEECTQKFRAGQGMNSAIIYDGQLVGMCGFNQISTIDDSVAIAYWLGKQYQGKGIVTACVNFLTEYAFKKLNMNCVRIAHAVGNDKSRALVERCGFSYDGTIRSGEYMNHHYVDIAMYSMLKSEWEAVEHDSLPA